LSDESYAVWDKAILIFSWTCPTHYLSPWNEFCCFVRQSYWYK